MANPYYQDSHVTICNATEHLVIDMDARAWCKLPYPGHPKGCPNYGNRRDCPPTAPPINYFVDLAEIWLVIVQFDLGIHVVRMKGLHPNWSERQARCLLYWQGAVNKRLKNNAEQFASAHDMRYTLCPEAMGVHVLATLEKLGLPIERNPQKLVHKVALCGRQQV